MKKPIKYAIWLVMALFITYNSVYFKKLDEVKAATNTNFSAADYAQKFWKNKLPAATAKAVDIDQLLSQLQASPQQAFAQHGHALAIGSTRFFMVKGSGTVTKVSPDEVQLSTTGKNSMQLATEYVYGNAVRDASNLIKVNDFTNTLDLSNLSAELNKIIRKQVLPPFKSQVKTGAIVQFTGAMELNQAHLNLTELEVIPVSLKLQP